MKTLRMLLLALPLLASGCGGNQTENRRAAVVAGLAPEQTREQGVIAAIRKRGGDLQVDERTPGQPAVLMALEGPEWGDADLAALADLKSLGVLSLKASLLTDQGLARLPGKDRLQVLLINDTQVTDAGLAALKGSSRLERLDLSGTRVTDAGLKHLAGLGTLRIIHIGDTEVTDAGLRHLKGLSSLEHLHVKGAANITDKGLLDLQGSFPKLKVYR